MTAIRSVVLGCGSYLPQRILTNAELATQIDTSDEWIVQRTGIRQRHIAADGEFTSHLAINAARAALIIPKDFGRDMARGYTSPVQMLVDGSDSNTAQLVSAYAKEVASAFNQGNAGAGPFINFNTTYDITDALAKVWNGHTFKTGFYMQKSIKDQTSFGAFDGNYNFGDNSANPYDTGFGFSNAALGVFNSFSQAANFINGQYRYWNIEFYLQDTWKVSSRLTLD